MGKRGLQYFTLSEIEPRVWFMLTGCNFRCKGCFRPARDERGTVLTARETLERMEEACLNYYGNVPAEALITGGEPTIDKEFLLGLVNGLRERDFQKIVIMSNGYALGEDENYVDELEEAGLTEAHIDLKAFSEDKHRYYTGKSNKPVLQAIEKLNVSGIELLVQTIYMPGIVDEAEIAKIAQFLASLNRNMRYRINPFAPVFAYQKVTRRPTLEEMERAYNIALRYLPNAIISRSCYREFPTPSPQKTWITVYPDLSIKRRGMKEQAEDRLSWLSNVRSRESVMEDWQKEKWDFTLRHSLVGASELPDKRNAIKEAGNGLGPVKVKFPRSLHDLTERREIVLDLNGSKTVEEVLARLVNVYGEEFRARFMDGGEIKRSFNVYLNGMNIKNLDGIKTEVHRDDELIILSWVSGG
jgi:pyruvate formate lyase activating enzyme